MRLEDGTEFLDRLKDTVHEQYFEIKELKERIQKAISLIEKHTTSFGNLILEKQLTELLISILDYK